MTHKSRTADSFIREVTMHILFSHTMRKILKWESEVDDCHCHYSNFIHKQVVICNFDTLTVLLKKNPKKATNQTFLKYSKWQNQTAIIQVKIVITCQCVIDCRFQVHLIYIMRTDKINWQKTRQFQSYSGNNVHYWNKSQQTEIKYKLQPYVSLSQGLLFHWWRTISWHRTYTLTKFLLFSFPLLQKSDPGLRLGEEDVQVFLLLPSREVCPDHLGLVHNRDTGLGDATCTLTQEHTSIRTQPLQ